MESEDVDAVNVRSTGESASKARKTRIEDFSAFAPVAGSVTEWIV